MVSSRKQKEKKKDFQKTRLKVGKTKAKPDNFTDTSFKAKAIVVGHQSIAAAVPDSDARVSHYLSVLNHYSAPHRRDALLHLTSRISARPVDNPLPVPLPVLLPKILPLIVDAAGSVRSQLLLLLAALPASEVSGHVEKIVLFIHSAMTHLAADIRSHSTRFLGWLLDEAGEELVSTPAGWLKTMKCFLALFGWEASAKDVGQPSFQRLGSDAKSAAKHLSVLKQFLKIGLLAPEQEQETEPQSYVSLARRNLRYPAVLFAQNLLPVETNCFAYLGLFGSASLGGTERVSDDVAARRQAATDLLPVFAKGLKSIVKDAGDHAALAAASLAIVEAR